MIVLNDHSACYTLLDSLDVSFKRYVKDCLSDDFFYPIVWMQVIKALQSDSLKHSKTMKCELENLNLQQYTGQNVTDMLLDVVTILKPTPQLASGTTSSAQASCLASSLAMVMRCTTLPYYHEFYSRRLTQEG